METEPTPTPEEILWSEEEILAFEEEIKLRQELEAQGEQDDAGL